MTQQVIYLGKKFNTSKVFVDDIDNEKKLKDNFFLSRFNVYVINFCQQVKWENNAEHLWKKNII